MVHTNRQNDQNKEHTKEVKGEGGGCARRISATKVKLQAIEHKATRSHLGLNNGRWYHANKGVFIGITSCISRLCGTCKLSAPSC